MLGDAQGLRMWEVIDAAATKPFGFMPFYPGPGLGGALHPVDPYYCPGRQREYDLRNGSSNGRRSEHGEDLSRRRCGGVASTTAGNRGRLARLVLGRAYKKMWTTCGISRRCKIIELLTGAAPRSITTTRISLKFTSCATTTSKE